MLDPRGPRTRRTILDAAIARFGREGYRSTSVADIARDASVGGTVAYAYFPSKEALFLAAVDEDAAGVIREGLSTVMADPDIRTTGAGSLIYTLIGAVADRLDPGPPGAGGARAGSLQSGARDPGADRTAQGHHRAAPG